MDETVYILCGSFNVDSHNHWTLSYQKSGKKRVFIPEEMKAEVVKSVKIKVKKAKNMKSES